MLLSGGHSDVCDGQSVEHCNATPAYLSAGDEGSNIAAAAAAYRCEQLVASQPFSCFACCILLLLLPLPPPSPLHTHTHTHTPFNGALSGTIRMSRYQKGKTNLDFTEARDSEWQWRQLGHMQVCTSLQTDNHASTPPLKCFLQAG